MVTAVGSVCCLFRGYTE